MANRQTVSRFGFKKLALGLAPVALLTISGCATTTPFRANVSRYQQMPAPQGQSFIVKAADAADQGGLEFGSYAAMVTGQMQKLGYVPVVSGATPDMTVTLGYGVDKGKERRVSDPFYDPYWGYGGRGGFGIGFGRGFYGRGGLGHHRFRGGWYDPFLFGGYGFNGPYGVNSYTVYTSGMDMKIDRASDGQRLFEGKAEAKSRSKRLDYLVPNLVEAMFTGFPGNNGETVRISVAPEKKK